MSDEMNYNYGTSDQNDTNQGDTAQQDTSYGGPVEYGYSQQSSPDPQNSYEPVDYGASQYQDPYVNGTPDEKTGFAVASLVLGIISLIISCFGYNIITGILAIIFGAIHLSKRQTRRGMAIAGLVLGIVSIAIFIILVVVIAVGIMSSPDMLDSILNQM